MPALCDNGDMKPNQTPYDPLKDAESHKRKQQAKQIAREILDGFERHFTLFQELTGNVKNYYEAADWHAIQNASADRINYYDLRVEETIKLLKEHIATNQLDNVLWRQVKNRYTRELIETHHLQPELAETFYNSVFCGLFDRTHYNNENIFVRPAVSTEYIDTDNPVYQCFYPAKHGFNETLQLILERIDLDLPFFDLQADINNISNAFLERFPDLQSPSLNFQIRVLKPLFFRNKAAYLIGKVINGFDTIPFILPILRHSRDAIFVDALLTAPSDLSAVFNFARSYFMVKHSTPGAIVNFLREIVPSRSVAELYSSLGLHKQGKTDFYRDFLNHIRHSEDDFILAPGIKGLVMAVFTLPSYPYVFKIIKDDIEPPKSITKQQVKEKYQLVKQHDRVGRMADTLEYSMVSLPRERFEQEVLDELQSKAPSEIDVSDTEVVIRHLYIERRMIPLNLYLDRVNAEQQQRIMIDYGTAIKQMIAANIFPGDMLLKNFGVTTNNKVVFYDYDEVTYLTDCHFRKIPEPMYPEQEMASEPWYTVDKNDVFPEEFGSFILVKPEVRKAFMEHHADLLDYQYWRQQQDTIRAGRLPNIFPYSRQLRFNDF